MKRNKYKLLILASITAFSIISFGLSNKNMTKTPSKPATEETSKKAGLKPVEKKKTSYIGILEKIFPLLELDILYGTEKGKEENLQKAFHSW